MRRMPSLLFLMTLCALLSAAQQPERSATPTPQSLEEMEAKGVKMSFDVSSVKLNNSGGRFASNIGPLYPGAPYSPTGGFFSATNANLAVLVMFAYDLDSSQFLDLLNQLKQLPKWATADHFDLEAKSAGNPSREQIQLMMQSLLADRFKLVAHRETKSGPVFALVLAKPGKLGPQLRPDAEPCPTESSASDLATPADGSEFPANCGAVRMVPSAPGRMRIGGRSVTMESYATNLSGPVTVDRPVVDRTGLSGRFDFWIEYQPNNLESSGANSQANADGPTFLEALRDQLGLKLEPQTGPISVLVIDHVDRPTPN